MLKRLWSKMNKRVLTIGGLEDPSDEKAYWRSKTPEERIAAIEINRQVNYGYDVSTTRFQRFFEIAELKKR